MNENFVVSTFKLDSLVLISVSLWLGKHERLSLNQTAEIWHNYRSIFCYFITGNNHKDQTFVIIIFCVLSLIQGTTVWNVIKVCTSRIIIVIITIPLWFILWLLTLYVTQSPFSVWTTDNSIFTSHSRSSFSVTQVRTSIPSGLNKSKLKPTTDYLLKISSRSERRSRIQSSFLFS